MSYIDCFDHSDVGSFLGLRLYHPLEMLDDEAWLADQTCLVLGGGGIYGSGEHPSIVFKSLDEVVYWYLDFLVDNKLLGDIDMDDPEYKTLEALQDLIPTFTDREFPQCQIHHALCMGHIVELAKEIDKVFVFDNPEGNNYLEPRYERKLAILMGEVVYHLGRRLLTAPFLQALDRFEQTIRHKRPFMRRHFDVLQPAILGWSCSGRITYTDVNGRKNVHHGVSFIDEEAIINMAQDFHIKRDSDVRKD